MGHFEIGSWAGISLLTKALPLTTASGRGRDAAAAACRGAGRSDGPAPDRGTARSRVATARAGANGIQRPALGRLHPRCAEKPGPRGSARIGARRGEMAGAVSWILIRRHPLGALSLWAHDWLSLVVQPAYWPAAMTKVSADQSAFYACREQSNCWALARYDLPLSGRIVLLGVSMAGAAAALVPHPAARLAGSTPSRRTRRPRSSCLRHW